MYVYLARVAALDAGVAQEAPTLTLNRLCGSGLQAIVSAAQSILLGHADIAVGAGCQTARNAENFSASHWLLHVNGSVAISVLSVSQRQHSGSKQFSSSAAVH
jgi:acetyl-CoA acetyltransferase